MPAKIKEQTYITIFEDAQGRTVDFQRFEYKKLNTCLQMLFKYYAKMMDCKWLREDLASAVKVVTYKTSDKKNKENKVSEIDIDLFWNTVAETKKAQTTISHREK